MKALVTGGAGFIGSHISEGLVQKGFEVRVLDDLSSGKKENLSSIIDKIEFIEGSVTDKSTVEKAVSGADYVFHEAALVSVVESVSNPEKTHQINVEGTRNILESALDAKVKRVMFASSAAIYGDADPPITEEFAMKPMSPYGESKVEGEKLMKEFNQKGLETVCLRYFNCYDKETEILTEEGFKLFMNLTYKDKIATLNPKTGTLEYHYPIEIQKIKHNGKLLHFKSKRIDLMVTPDNNMYTRSRKNYQLRTANEIIKNRRYYDRLKQDCIWVGNKEKYESIPAVKNKDNHHKSRLRESNRKKRIPMSVWVTFLGWFLSEGSVFSGLSTSYGKQVRFYRVSISQKDDQNCKEILELCKKMGFNPYKNTNKRGISDITISSKQLYNYLRRFSVNKHIPKHILSLDKKYLLLLFETLMKGDGNADGSRFSTKSKQLANDFQELLLKIGMAGRILKEQRSDRIIYRIKISKITSPTIGDPHTKKVFCKNVQYNDYVYDVTVPNHIIFVRRNGFVCWSGNCYGPRQDPTSQYSGVITRFIGKMLKKESPTIYGDGNQSRDFIYVDDVVTANLNAAEKEGIAGGSFNIGSGVPITINQLEGLVSDITGHDIDPIYAEKREGDIYDSYADVSKALKNICFKTSVPIDAGLRKTVEWQKNTVTQ